MNVIIPFTDLKAGYQELKPELDRACQKVMTSGSYILGAEVSEFENEFAAYCRRKHCVGVSSGMEALKLILQAKDIGPGDEVIVPSHTFIATWLAVIQAGARPVPVDIEESGYNLDPDLLEAAVSPQTRAAIAVHIYGQTADMEPLKNIASRHNLLLIEDAAQAHGAVYKNQVAGSLGDAAAFSFYPTKNLGAFGDAGAVVCDDDGLAETIRQLRNVGRNNRHEHILAGHNSRMDELQAALLRVKLPYLEQWNNRRRLVAAFYLSELSGLDLWLPVATTDSKPVWHLFVVRTPHRDRLLNALNTQGIQAMVHYPSTPYLYPACSSLGYGPGTCPQAEQLTAEVLSLPVWPQMTLEQAHKVVKVLRSVLA